MQRTNSDKSLSSPTEVTPGMTMIRGAAVRMQTCMKLEAADIADEAKCEQLLIAYTLKFMGYNLRLLPLCFRILSHSSVSA